MPFAAVNPEAPVQRARGGVPTGAWLAVTLAALWPPAAPPAVVGQAGAPAAAAVPTMPVEELRAGMRGVGYTVVRGREPERFDIEVLGVLRNALPKQDIVIARLSGLELERSGVIAGMSGSPVYVDGRLVGAVAYRLGTFQTEAIAGITPIESMLRMAQLGGSAEERLAAVRPDLAGGLLAAAAGLLAGGEPAELLSLVPVAGTAGIQPIATPVTIGGVHPEVVARLGRLFEALGWQPVLGGTVASSAPVELRPGSTVAAQLMRGDISVTASGTVTYRDGDRLLAFGHPFLQGGSVDFPMVGAEVLVVINSLSAPEKLTAATGEVLGAIRQDRQTGILGILGAEPRTIPVRLAVDGGGVSEEFAFELVSDKLLSPLFLFLGLANGLQSVDKAFGDSALEVGGEFYLGDDLGSVRIRNLFSSENQAFVSMSATIAAIFHFLYDNAFRPVEVRSIELSITVRDDRKVAEISRVWYDRPVVRPGETVHLTVWLKPYRAPEVAEQIAVEIPEELEPGPLTLLVGDAVAVSREEQGFIQGEFAPRSLRHLVRLLNNIRTNDRIYVQLSRPDDGALVRGEVMPSLPLSLWRVLFLGQTSGEVVRLKRSVILEEEQPVEYVVSGEHRVELTVRRR